MKKHISLKPLPIKPYLIYLLVLLIACFTGWISIWISYEKFEIHSIQKLLGDVSTQLSEERNGEVTYKKISSENEGYLTYDFYVDDVNTKQVVFKALDTEGPLGMSMYEIYSEKGNKELEFMAIVGSDILVGDKALSDLEPVETITLPGLERVENMGIELPVVGKYILTDLSDIPKLIGSGLINIETDKGNMYAFEMSEEDLKDIKSSVDRLTRDYSLFITNDQPFENCKANMVANTPIFKQIRQIYVYDYTEHSKVEFSDFEYSNAVSFTDNFAKITVAYDYTVTGRIMTSTYSPIITYYMYKDKGHWKALEMYISE